MKPAPSIFGNRLSPPRFVLKSVPFFLFSLAIGMLGGVFYLTPMGLALEEEQGLAWLFLARGALSPPQDVVIISIDQSSAETLGFDDNPDKWPREYYVQLLEHINRQQPAIVALDVLFKDDRDPQTDQQLAEAIARNGNVVLGNYLKNKSVPISGNSYAASIQSLVESIDGVNAAALFAAPFLLPKTSSTVKQFWINKDSAGDLRTFPDVVFQCYVFKTAYTEILSLLNNINPTLAAQLPNSFAQLAKEQNVMDALEQILAEFARHNSPAEWAQLIAQAPFPAKQQALLTAWLKVLNSKNVYLNHYGDVGTITTIPFYQALKNLPPNSLRDKVVMVGYSESIEPEKNPGFYTVYSNANNQTISGVEIAATAVGNLIDNIWLLPLETSQPFLLLLGWGMLLSVLCRVCPYRWAIGLMVLLGGCYAYAAYYKFATAHIWLPLVIPIGLQLPLVIIGVSILHFRQTDRTKHTMQQVLHNLLPKEIVETLPNTTGNGTMDTSARQMQGVCLATDICGYTQLSETLEPNALITLMNGYYETLFPLVAQHQGYVTDLAGDGLYAVWLNPGNTRQAPVNACHAALAIKASLKQMNKTLDYPLTTRFGLTCGEISIGHTGAPGRYVYRAMGDPVNTASRIEGLNKHLGTQILVATALSENMPDFLFRDLGFFKLKGKAKPVPVHELIKAAHENDAATRQLLSEFALALGLFQNQQWEAALGAFQSLQKNFPDDGPTQFFIAYVNALQAHNGASSNISYVIIDVN